MRGLFAVRFSHQRDQVSDFNEVGNGGRDKIRTCDPYDVNVVL